MNTWRFVTGLSLVMLLGACTMPQPKQQTLDPEASYWQEINAAGIGFTASLAQSETGVLVIAQQSDDGISNNIYVKRWDGTNWNLIGTSFLDANANRDASSASLALDSAGNPTVSWFEYDGTTYNIYVKRWDGTNWVQLGSILDANVNRNAQHPSLALDSAGIPTVSWYEHDGTTYNIYVKRWNGSSWINVGSGVLSASSAADTHAYSPSLALDSSGNPVVAWFELEGPSPFTRTRNIYVKRFDGTNWVNVGGGELTADAFSDSLSPSLALDSSGNPVVAWQEGDGVSENIYVNRWNGTNWVYLGTTLDVNNNRDAHDPSLALDSSGNPVVGWSESDGTSPNIYVKRWNGSSWVLVGSNPLDAIVVIGSSYPSLSLVNGSLAVTWLVFAPDGVDLRFFIWVRKYITNSWQPLGSLLNVNSGQSAVNSVITKKSNNIPVVVWDEVDSSNGLRNVYVKEWNGFGWSALGGAIDRTVTNDAKNPSIAMRTDNRPTVAFQENNNIYIRRWSGTAWVTVGAALDTVLANSAITPSIALDSGLIPIVAFAEKGDILVKKANGVIASSVWNSPFGTVPLDTIATHAAYRPSLALKSDNNPIVAWYEKVGTNFNIYAKQWNGTAWVALGTTIDITASRNAKDIVIAIGTDNRPVVAWEEAKNIYVKQWTGTAWVSVGSVLDNSASNEALRPAIDLRTDNNPVVSWQEWNGTSYDVWVKRWTGSTWTLIGNVVDKNISQNAKRPSLVLKSNNSPMISWDEWNGSSENVHVKQY